MPKIDPKLRVKRFDPTGFQSLSNAIRKRYLVVRNKRKEKGEANEEGGDYGSDPDEAELENDLDEFDSD